jgi:hypothetical protein
LFDVAKSSITDTRKPGGKIISDALGRSMGPDLRVGDFVTIYEMAPALSGVVFRVTPVCHAHITLSVQSFGGGMEVKGVILRRDHLIQVCQWTDLDLGLHKRFLVGGLGPRFGAIKPVSRRRPPQPQIAVALDEQNRIIPGDDGPRADEMAHFMNSYAQQERAGVREKSIFQKRH